MEIAELKSIVQVFDPEPIVSIHPLTGGHIHTTWVVECNGSKRVLQRINTQVFSQVDALIENYILLRDHFDSAGSPLIVQWIAVEEDTWLWQDGEEQYWRMMEYIDGKTYPFAISDSMAHWVGVTIAQFHQISQALPVKKIQSVLPQFTNLASRFQAFEEAMKADSAGRLSSCPEICHWYRETAKQILPLDQLIQSETIPPRIVHLDAKLQNIRFSNDDRPLGLLDLDTCGPGSFLHDIGEGLRSVSTSVPEDQVTELSFSSHYYQACLAGYLEHAESFLDPLEKEHVHWAGPLMCYFNGIRFLTDYLIGDSYYHIDYEDQNIQRAQSQRALYIQMYKLIPN